MLKMPGVCGLQEVHLARNPISLPGFHHWCAHTDLLLFFLAIQFTILQTVVHKKHFRYIEGMSTSPSH